MVEISDTARAASLAISNARPFLIGNKDDLRKIKWAIEPIKGFVWSKELISAVCKIKGGCINDLLCCVRGTCYPKADYGDLRKMFRFALASSETLVPQNWEIWRTLLTLFSLYEINTFLEWMDIVNSLETVYIFVPPST